MKRTIAIVAGGNSSEHDVSLHSAAGILSFMDTEKYDCYVVEMQGTDWHVDYNDTRLPIDRNDFSFTAPDGRHTFDFAYITIHGTPGEDGILQGYFDLIHLPYSTSLRKSLLSLLTSGSDEINRCGQAGIQLAHFYSEVIEKLLNELHLKANDICAVGVHGQTIRHCPELGFF